MSTDEIIVFDLAEPGGELVAAVGYLACLIYPGSLRQRDRFVAAAFAYGVRACRMHDKPAPVWASDVLAEVKQRDQFTRMQKAHRILERRLMAAEALVRVLDGRSVADVLEPAGNRAHLMRKVWSESLPVVHLAWALTTSLPNDPHAAERPLLMSLIACPEWVIEAAAQSESKIEHLALSMRFDTRVAAALAGWAATPKVRVSLRHCAYSPTGRPD